MPIDVDWYRPYRVVDERVWGMVTGDDTRQHIDLLSSMLNKAQVHAPGRLVYLLYDDTEVETMPPIYLMLKQGLPVLRFKNRGPVFYVTRRKAISSIVELAAHVMRFKMRSFSTRKEALEALEKVLAEDDLRSAE